MMRINLARSLSQLLVLLFLFALEIPPAHSQDSYSSLHFDQLTIDEGLSHNTVNCLLQDHYGYIWIGTHNGLNRYDGYSFLLFTASDQPDPVNGFFGQQISALFEDRENNLWVGTRKHGINIRKSNSDRFENLKEHPAFEPILHSEITSISEDSSGNIWITTVDKGILKYHPSTGTSTHYNTQNSGLSSLVIFDLVEDKYGTIWVAPAGPGLNILTEDGQFEYAHQPQPNSPNMSGYRKKLVLEDSILWVCTEGTGLYRMNIEDRSYTRFSEGVGNTSLNSNSIRDVYPTTDGQVFIASDGGGLNIYQEGSGVVQKYTHQVRENNSINSNALFCFLKDQTGNLWIGTYNGGVNIYKVHKTGFDFFSSETGRGQALGSRSILSILQDQKDRIWVGTDGGGISWLDSEQEVFIRPDPPFLAILPEPLTSTAIKTLFQDSQGTIWIGIFGKGLYLYDPEIDTLQRFEDHLNQNLNIGDLSIWSITERSSGELWIGVIGFGIIVYDIYSEELQIHQPDPEDPISLIEPNIIVLFADSEDRVWVGTGDYGLQLWDEQLEGFLSFQHDSEDTLSLSNNEIRAVYEDTRGNIWIGTEGGGLNRWLGEGQFERFTQEDGLLSNSIMGITEDAYGMLWISSFEGISRLNLTTKEIHNFDFHAGENNNQFNQMSILTSEEGALFFGGINGLHTLDPEAVKTDTVSPSIIFTELRVFNNTILSGPDQEGRVILDKAIEAAEKIQLSHQDNSFSIEFAAMDFTAPQEHLFSYRMVGFDDNWQETPQGEHRASYTNLSPGSYTFIVRHKNSEASIEVLIKPPFWKTTWFQILITFITLGVFLIVISFVFKRREATHKRKLLEAERAILQLQNEKLEAEVIAKNSKLISSAAQMAHKNEVLANVKQSLQESTDPNRSKLIRMLNRELKNEDYWDEFNSYFNQIDTNFTQSLADEFPALTPNDLRICTLLRINLSSKEIASLLNVSVRAVEQSRYRLKKRLSLSTEDTLAHFITSYRPNK